MNFKKKCLKIIFVTNNYTPYSGGVVSSINAFAVGLREQGHQVYIVTLDFKDVQRENNVIRLYCPLKFTYKNNPMAVPWYTAQALEQIFLQIKPDIVHSNHPFLLGSAAQIVCRQLHIPLVFTHHTQYDQYLHYVPITQKLTKLIVNQLVAYYCNRCDLVIAPSRAIKKRLKKQLIKSSIEVVPSPLLPIFSENMQRFELKKIMQTHKLLYVGRFTEEKNISFLLDLVNKSGPDIKLQLVGYGYYQQELEDYAYQKLCLHKDQVQFLCKPPKKRIAQLYKDADLFVFASTTETQGLVLVEAMSAGTPVVALKGPGQDEVVKDGENGFLVDSRQRMKDVIERILQDRDLFEKLQYGAWQTGRQYAMNTVTMKLFNCYQAKVEKYEEKGVLES